MVAIQPTKQLLRPLLVAVKRPYQGTRFFSATASSSSSFRRRQEEDLAYAVAHVRDHDPAGYLPGQLLPTETMKISYYAVRNFWIETGLRFASTAKVPRNATPEAHLQWWSAGIQATFDADAMTPIENSSEFNHPTLRMLQYILQTEKVPWEKASFDAILEGRRKDLHVKQYETMDDLVHHAEQSCGQLNRLILQSGFVDEDTNPRGYQAARLVGICHGLTNALRTSIPVISTTGKLIVPVELTQKYGVQSPRYLLSALGQGDDERCVQALQSAVEEIAETARSYLHQARALRSCILSEPDRHRSLPVLLPAIASEVFLNRLKERKYLLTDRELRNVGMTEHALCAARMVLASYQQTY